MKRMLFTAERLLFASLFLFTFIACDDDDVPPEENEEEAITNVTLTFTPSGGGNAVEATWVDADGEGSGAPVLTDIELAANTTYTMSIELTNALDPTDVEDVTEEIEEEDEEHMFFFGWTDGLFTDPTGDGNIDTRSDAVNYEDPLDDNGYPVGLETEWTTGDAATGEFRIVLKHQPDIKTASSTATDGESDIDIRWNIEIQ